MFIVWIITNLKNKEQGKKGKSNLGKQDLSAEVESFLS